VRPVRQRALASLLAAVLLILPGCAKKAATNPGADPSEQGAVAVLTAYLEARREGEIGKAYSYLTDAAKQAISETEMKRYYEGITQFTWGSLAAPKTVDEGWVRVIAYDISAVRDGQAVHEPEFPYYLNRENGRWALALINPLIGRLGQLHQQGASAQQIYDLTQLILKINPYSYRAYVELYFLLLEAGELQAAAVAIDQMYEMATPSDLPEVNGLRGEFLTEIAGEPMEGKQYLTLALQMADSYPQRYGPNWKAYTLLQLARSHKDLNEHDAAKQAAMQAYGLDPNNRLVKEFLAEYGLVMP
jgi:hypothetical protein